MIWEAFLKKQEFISLFLKRYQFAGLGIKFLVVFCLWSCLLNFLPFSLYVLHLDNCFIFYLSPSFQFSLLLCTSPAKNNHSDFNLGYLDSHWKEFCLPTFQTYYASYKILPAADLMSDIICLKNSIFILKFMPRVCSFYSGPLKSQLCWERESYTL